MPQSPTRPQAEDLLAFAGRLADAARDVTLAHFRTRIDVDNKHEAGFDPVTIADRDAEVAIRSLIEAAYPDHGIIGEEHLNKPSRCGLNWVLDPIDGTRSYITGSPLWGTLIALADETGPFIGLIDQPYIGERFWGVSLPAWREAGMTGPRGHKPLRTRACTGISDAIVGSTHPDLFATAGEAAAFARLGRAARMTRFGGDCYAYGLLAMGFMDLIVETGLQPYDIQAIIPIVEGAGGRVTNWQGDSAAGGGQVIAAGDAKAHAAAMEILSVS